MPRTKKIGGIKIPTTESEVEDTRLRGTTAAAQSRKPVRGLADRRQRLRSGRQAASALVAATIGVNRLAGSKPASPESKRNGSITPSTTPQVSGGNGKTPVSRFNRAEQLRRLEDESGSR